MVITVESGLTYVFFYDVDLHKLKLDEYESIRICVYIYIYTDQFWRPVEMDLPSGLKRGVYHPLNKHGMSMGIGIIQSKFKKDKYWKHKSVFACDV